MRSSNRQTILVVEDDDLLLRLVVGAIRNHGYQVFSAADGEQGLEVFVTMCPDLVVTNIHMPKLNGFQLLAGIKRVSPTTPVILTTGFGHFRTCFPETIARADAFFEKPLNPDEILACIAKLLEDKKRLVSDN